MARIVAGFAASYSPQLHVPSESWAEMGRNDIVTLLGSGEDQSRLDQLVLAARSEVEPAISAEEQAVRQECCQGYIATIARRASEARLDALLMLAEDEQGLLEQVGGPEVLIFRGGEVPYRFGGMPAEARWAYGEQAALTGAPEVGAELESCLGSLDVRIAATATLPEGHSIGHHAGFINTRILQEESIPILPILFNSSRLPTPAQTYRLGQAIRQVISSMPGDARIGVFAIGGLSHILIDESLDRRLLAACASDDAATLASLPPDRDPPSHGHNRPWIAAAPILTDLQMNLLGYVPAYRSPAGTGCGMAFAVWE